MRLADEVNFEIYFGKIGEIKFPKNHSGIFDGTFQFFFLGNFRKIMIGIGLLHQHAPSTEKVPKMMIGIGIRTPFLPS